MKLKTLVLEKRIGKYNSVSKCGAKPCKVSTMDDNKFRTIVFVIQIIIIIDKRYKNPIILQSGPLKWAKTHFISLFCF